MITLQKALKMIEDGKGDIDELSQNPELNEFMNDISALGSNILTQLSEDEQIGAVSLLQASVAGDLLADGNVLAFMFCIQEKTMFGAMMAVALRQAVGLAAVENWMMLRDR